jgi:hypothetical protein
MGVGKMSKCQCDLRTKLVGDGCRYCNAQEYIDKLIESLEELIEAIEEQRTWVSLSEDEITQEVGDSQGLRDIIRNIEHKLKEKNT